MKTQTLRNLKEELKLIADLIKQKKPLLRQVQSRWFKNLCLGGNPQLDRQLTKNKWDLEVQLASLIHSYRHKHIVYCQLRGKALEQIENKRRLCTSKSCSKFAQCCNKPDQNKLNELLAHYGTLVAAEIARENLKGVVGETPCARQV
jgi:hypothetical protein